MKKNIYYLGNHIEKKDILGPIIAQKLIRIYPDIDFLPFDPTEDIMFQNNKNLIVIDTVAGLTNVKLYSSLSCFSLSPLFSVHDYDLPLELSLLVKLGKINHFSIIGLPQGKKPDFILPQVIEIISRII